MFRKHIMLTELLWKEKKAASDLNYIQVSLWDAINHVIIPSIHHWLVSKNICKRKWNLGRKVVKRFLQITRLIWVNDSSDKKDIVQRGPLIIIHFLWHTKEYYQGSKSTSLSWIQRMAVRLRTWSTADAKACRAASLGVSRRVHAHWWLGDWSAPSPSGGGWRATRVRPLFFNDMCSGQDTHASLSNN